MWQTKRSFIHKIGLNFDAISGVLFLVLAAISNVDLKASQSWPELALTTINLIKNNSFWLWCAVGLMALAGFITRRYGDPWIKGKLKFVIDNFQKKAYDGIADPRNHNHRVTLFKRKKVVVFHKRVWGGGHWPWNGWLVPVIRSGHKTKGTKAIFLAPENEDAEGIVGYAWDAEMQISVDNLPRLVQASSDHQVSKYAKRTFCSPEQVQLYCNNNKPLPRSIGAMPVFVNGEIWGALVLDSQSPGGVSEQLMENFTLTVETIGQLLEKA